MNKKRTISASFVYFIGNQSFPAKVIQGVQDDKSVCIYFIEKKGEAGWTEREGRKIEKKFSDEEIGEIFFKDLTILRPKSETGYPSPNGYEVKTIYECGCTSTHNPKIYGGGSSMVCDFHENILDFRERLYGIGKELPIFPKKK